MRREIINEYRKLNSEDQKVFHRWLWTNTIVGAILLAGLIALTFKFTSDETVSIAQTPEINTQTKVNSKAPAALMHATSPGSYRQLK
jgi:hypothetical protein